MHLPDHYLDPTVCAITAAAAGTAVVWGVVRGRRSARPTGVAPYAVAAGIAAAQMLNVPISPGTSGHFLGGALAALLLGPYTAMWTMSLVLAIQCFLFGDGGVAALGANILNMAVIAPWCAWWVYRALCNDSSAAPRQMIAAGIAAWFSVMAAAIACSMEVALSGAHPLLPTLIAMTSVHALIGLGEACITAAVVALAHSSAGASIRPSWRPTALTIGVLAVALLAPLASALPDGLEATAERLGFVHSGMSITLSTIFQDYAVPGVASPVLATVLAAVVAIAATASAALAFEVGVGRVRK